MTVASTPRVAGPFIGTGADAVLPFVFKVFEAADLLVQRTVGAAAPVELVLDSDYTVSLNVDQDETPGGSVTILAAANTLASTVYVTSQVVTKQEAALRSQGGYYPKTIEDQLDRIVMVQQQLRDQYQALADQTGVDLFGNIRTELASSTAGKGGSLVAFIQSGTGGVLRDIMEKARESVSIYDYGVVGDGSADDTAALQLADDKATAMGCSLKFPSRRPGGGTTKVKVGQIDRGGCDWIGDSTANARVLSKTQVLAPGEGMVEMFDLDATLTEGITFDITAATGSGIAFGALFMFAGEHNAVRKCRFLGIKTYAIGVGLAAASNDNVIDDNYFECPVPNNVYNQAVNISAAGGMCTGTFVTNNRFNGTGIYSDGSKTYVHNNRGFGGCLFGSYCCLGPAVGQINCMVIGNNFADGGLGPDSNSTYVSGIENWASYTTIHSNICGNNGGHGISSGGTSCNIAKNTCQNNGQSAGHGVGIALYRTSIGSGGLADCDPSNTIVNDNTLIDSQGSPTQLYGYAEYHIGGADVLRVAVNDNICSGNLTAKYLFDSHFTGRTFRGEQFAFRKAITPGSIAANATVIGNVTVPGARMDYYTVRLDYNKDRGRVTVMAQVDANDSIRYVFHNPTASPIVLADGYIFGLVEEVVSLAA